MSYAKSDDGTVCKDENVQFFNLLCCMSYTARKTTVEDKKNEIFPDTEGFICKENLDIHIWLDSICPCAMHCFHGRSFLSNIR